MSCIVCPRCQMVSANPGDLANGYCGNCHDFTSDPQVARLKARLVELGVPARWGEDTGRWLKIETGDVFISIEPRPPYCDRGRWIVKADSHSYKLSIDSADGFPRYYFGDDACATEIGAWLRRRRLL